MVWWTLLGWLSISPVLALLIGVAVRQRDVSQAPVRAAEPVEAPEEQPEDRRAGELVSAAAGG